jgi:hypothetical protein
LFESQEIQRNYLNRTTKAFPLAGGWHIPFRPAALASGWGRPGGKITETVTSNQTEMFACLENQKIIV